MNILQIAPYFFPYQGGQERYIYYLSKELIKRGHKITIVTSNYPETKKFEEFEGINIIRHKCLFRPLRNPISPSILMEFNRLDNFDIIHAHNEHSFSSNIAVFFKYYTKKPLIITCHGQLRFNNDINDYFESKYNRSIGRLIFNSSDRIIALSQSDKKYVSSINIDSNKINIIPNAIDFLKFSKEISSINYNFFVNKYKLGNKKVVLFVGSIIKRKGIEYLLKAIPDVIIQNDDVIFLFVGDGDYLEKAAHQVKDLNINENVIFTGIISDQELICAYKSSDIFVLPSISEGMPTTILEAFALSKPVISTDIPGVRDYFQNYAVLVPPHDSKALSTAIKNLLNDAYLAKDLGLKGRQFVESKFSWEKITNQIEKIYYELIN